MLAGLRVAVVVPARNEAPRIARVVRTMPVFVDDIIVVDDGSQDGTGEVACAAGPERVRVIRHPASRGVGAAITSGYRTALELGADVAAVMAGDAQMDPADLERVLEPVAGGRADYVKGNRFAHPEVRSRMPKARRRAGRVLAALTRWAAGLPALSDSQCGYTAASARALRAIDLDALWTGYGYPNDLLGRLALAGQRIAEVPVRPIYAGEPSGVRPRHVLVIGGLLVRIALARATRRARAR